MVALPDSLVFEVFEFERANPVYASLSRERRRMLEYVDKLNRLRLFDEASAVLESVLSVERRMGW